MLCVRNWIGKWHWLINERSNYFGGIGSGIGEEAHLRPQPIYNFVCIRSVDGTGDIRIGNHCYINPRCVLCSGYGITMGDYALLFPGTN